MVHIGLLLGAILVATASLSGTAAAQERQLGSDGDVKFSIPSQYRCGTTAPVTVTAPDPSLFTQDQVRLQRLLGLIRVALGFECPTISNIEVTGVVGGNPVYSGVAMAANDWKLVSTQSAAVGQSPESARSEREFVREVQHQLNALGYEAGVPDGLMGRRTREALNAFQRDYGLPAGATLDATLTRLSQATLTRAADPNLVPAMPPSAPSGTRSHAVQPPSQGLPLETAGHSPRVVVLDHRARQTPFPAHAAGTSDLEIASENWARRSVQLLSQGKRRDAIVAALKGIPEGVTEDELARLGPAYLALFTALRSQVLELPVGDRVVETHDGVAVSVKGDRAVTESHTIRGERQLELWDVEAGTPLAVLVDDLGMQYHVQTVAFSPDGRYLALAGEAGMLHLHDARSGARLIERQAIRQLMLHPGDNPQFQGLAFSPSGDHLVSSGVYPADLTVWRVPDLEPVMSLDRADYDRLGVGAERTYAYANFANDGAVCVFLAKPEPDFGAYTKLFVGAWHLPTGDMETLHVREGSFTGLSIWASRGSCSADLQWIAIGYRDENLFALLDVIRVAGGDASYRLPNLLTQGTSFDPNGRYFATLMEEGWQFHDLRDFEVIPQPGRPLGFTPQPASLFNIATGRLLSLDLTGAAEQGGLRIWEDVPLGLDLLAAAMVSLTDEERRGLATERVGEVVLAEGDGPSSERHVATVSENWALRSHELLLKGLRREAIVAALKGLPAEPDMHQLERFAPAHLALYTAMRSNVVPLPLGERSLNHEVTFAPDGSRAVSQTTFPDGTIQMELWDTATKEVMAVLAVSDWKQGLEHHFGGNIAFSPDSLRLATAGLDGTIMLFDTRDGSQITQWSLSTAETSARLSMSSLEFSPTGAFLTAMTDAGAGKLMVWRMSDLQPVLGLTRAELDGEAATRTRSIMSSHARFANDDTICVSHAIPTGGRTDRDPVSMQVVQVALPTGAVRTLFRLPQPLQEPYLGMDGFACSRDLRRIAAVYTDDDGVQNLEVFNTETKESLFKRRNVEVYMVLFDPHAEMIAVRGNEGWEFIRVEDGATVSHPGVPEGFDFQPQQALHSGIGALLDNVDEAMLSLATNPIWDDFPQGAALIEYALESLTADERAEIEQDRL